MIVPALFAAAALTGMTGILLSNLLGFPRLRRAVGNEEGALASILIPARNEAAVVDATVRGLLAQTHTRFELLILDDNSADGTRGAALAAAGGDPRVRVIAGKPLPAGWAGKNWACHQLAEAAKGERLVFTDADTQWPREGLAAVLAEAERTRADLLTVWPTQITGTWAERLTVPLMALVVIGYLPVLMTHFTPIAAFGAATGQCLVFTRDAYRKIGGHKALAAEVLEDVKFARRVKSAGLRLRMADGAGFVACRMYDGWPAVRDGYAKNILAGYGGALPLLLGTLFHWLVFLLPPFWLLLGWLNRAPLTLSVAGVNMMLPSWPVAPLVLTAWGIVLRAITAAFSRQRPLDALLMPASAVLMTIISAKSLYWQVRFGGPVWKGRVIRHA